MCKHSIPATEKKKTVPNTPVEKSGKVQKTASFLAH